MHLGNLPGSVEPEDWPVKDILWWHHPQWNRLQIICGVKGGKLLWSRDQNFCTVLGTISIVMTEHTTLAKHFCQVCLQSNYRMSIWLQNVALGVGWSITVFKYLSLQIGFKLLKLIVWLILYKNNGKSSQREDGHYYLLAVLYWTQLECCRVLNLDMYSDL